MLNVLGTLSAVLRAMLLTFFIFPAGSPLLVAGCGDGSVRLYDIRKPSAEARVMTWREHNGYILEVFLQSLPTGPQRVISGWSVSLKIIFVLNLMPVTFII